MFTAGFVYRQLRRFQHAQAVQIKALPGLGQRQPPGVARQQSHPQLGLEPLDVKAHHRPGLAQQIGGGRQGTGFDYSFEGVESIETDHAESRSLSK